ncbi:hypothetical protein KJ765_06100 [Candidatus Micrarchaeota archaeon]|nr:hypothetical protein [Candidatus Micrarchaeota archaeon]
MINPAGTRLNQAVFISRDGYSYCYIEKNELRVFGESLASMIRSNESLVQAVCRDLKKETDRIREFMQSQDASTISPDAFHDFLNLFYAYVGPHLAVKRTVDFLPPVELHKAFSLFEDARKHSESVYAETEQYMQSFVQSIARNERVPLHLILCLTKDELETYFENHSLPSSSLLEERFKGSALLFKKGRYEVVSGPEVDLLEQAILSHSGNVDELAGTPAYKGVAQGRVSIVLDPSQATGFKEGDVLITGMTRPSFLMLMKKASAIVTDAGGMLCHAAIVARELRIPCITGTEKATTFFKNGDRVEVDANNGVVRKI